MSGEERRRTVPREALAERMAEVVGAGGVVVVAAEAGTGKSVLARQVVELLTGGVQVHDGSERLSSSGLAELGRALHNRPPGTGAIVLGRRDPGLCVVDLGATGPVLELDGADLAWSVAEVGDGLERWHAGGDPAQLTRQTEGWCAAVRLAAFVGEHALAPTSEPFKDYLFSEALRGVPEEHVAALTRACFLEDFPLDQEIAVLHRWRLFLRPAASGAWRVHGLVAAAVRRHLLVRRPADARRLRGDADDGQATSDGAITDPIVAGHAWSLLLDGRLTRPSSAALAVARAGTQPLRLSAGLALLAVGDGRRAAPLLPAPVNRDRGPAAMLARLMLARLAGDLAGVTAAAAALDRISDDPGVQAMALVEQGILEHDLGLVADAEQHLLIGADQADRAGRGALAARARGALALLCLTDGRLVDAERHAEQALLDGPPGFVDGRVRARLALAQSAFFRDERLGASELLEETRREGRGSRDEALWLVVLLHEAIMRAGLGDYDAARFTLAAASAAAGHPAGVRLGPTLVWLEARMLELEGRFDEAAVVIERIPPGREADLAVARRLVRDQQPRDAMAILTARLWPPGTPESFALRRSWDLVALAVAALAAADDEAAQDAIGRALDLAAPQLLRRPFLDEAVRLRPLLERQLRGGSAHGAFVADLLERADRNAPSGTPEAELREPLTERERTVLGLLPSSLTAAEIAATLTVSEATVRTHLRHIYEKLGVAGRHEAIRRGAELHYLARDSTAKRYN